MDEKTYKRVDEIITSLTQERGVVAASELRAKLQALCFKEARVEICVADKVGPNGIIYLRETLEKTVADFRPVDGVKKVFMEGNRLFAMVNFAPEVEDFEFMLFTDESHGYVVKLQIHGLRLKFKQGFSISGKVAGDAA